VLLGLDAAIRRRSVVGWLAFRTACGLLAALGLFCWLAVWFQRSPWLGAVMAINCGLVVAHELGMLGSRRDG
jgi:hypothetical protein